VRALVCLPLTLLTASCGNYWLLGEPLPPPCVKQIFWFDADQDGWGDADGGTELRCEGVTETFLTATNGLDCDDDDAGIGGKTGAACPFEVAGEEGLVTGFVAGQTEFLAIHGLADPVFYTEAETTCSEVWGGRTRTAGADTVDTADDVWETVGTLATFGGSSELAELQLEVEKSLDDPSIVWPVFSGFVGVTYDGVFVDGVWDSDAGDWETAPHWDGGWDWTGESDVTLNSIGWCNDELTPSDFYPEQNPADPATSDNFEQELPRLRVSLVLPLSGEWCLGVGADSLPAVTDDSGTDTGAGDTAEPEEIDDGRPGYSETVSHFVCQRPVADTTLYEGMTLGELPVEGSGE
jgi:hypothetical protein